MTLIVDTFELQGGEEVAGIKASTNYDQDSLEEQYGFNVSSYTDVSTGRLGVTIDNNFSDAYYVDNSEVDDELLSASLITNCLEDTSSTVSYSVFVAAYASSTINRTGRDAEQSINLFGDMA